MPEEGRKCEITVKTAFLEDFYTILFNFYKGNRNTWLLYDKINSTYKCHDNTMHKINSYKTGINKQIATQNFVKNIILTIRS